MSKLVFEIWLKYSKVDTKMFYKNCKKKHQLWKMPPNSSRSDLRHNKANLWIASAFNKNFALQHNFNWNKLQTEWDEAVNLVGITNVEFGFNKKSKKSKKAKPVLREPISAQNYPLIRCFAGSGLVVEFTALKTGTALQAGNGCDYGEFSDNWTAHTDKRWLIVGEDVKKLGES